MWRTLCVRALMVFGKSAVHTRSQLTVIPCHINSRAVSSYENRDSWWRYKEGSQALILAVALRLVFLHTTSRLLFWWSLFRAVRSPLTSCFGQEMLGDQRELTSPRVVCPIRPSKHTVSLSNYWKKTAAFIVLDCNDLLIKIWGTLTVV